MLETDFVMGPVTKRLVLRISTAAQRNQSPASQAVIISLSIADIDFPFDSQWSVLTDGDFSIVRISSFGILVNHRKDTQQWSTYDIVQYC